MEAAASVRKRPYFDDPLLELLFARGAEHEKAHIDSLRKAGYEALDLNHLMDRDEQVAATLAAMRAGTDVIVQGALRQEQWFGRPDLLRRISLPGPAHSGTDRTRSPTPSSLAKPAPAPSSSSASLRRCCPARRGSLRNTSMS